MVEHCSRRHARFVGSGPYFTAFLGESFTVGAVDVSDTDECTTLTAELRKVGSGSVGTA